MTSSAHNVNPPGRTVVINVSQTPHRGVVITVSIIERLPVVVNW